MKKVFCIALSLILIFALAVPAFAEAPVDDALFAQIKEAAAVDFPEGTYEVNQIGRLIVLNVYGEDAFASAALLIGFGDLADPSWDESLADVCEVQQRYQAIVGSEADDPVVMLNCFDTETRFLLFSVCEGTVLYDLSKTNLAEPVEDGLEDPAPVPVPDSNEASVDADPVVLIDQDGVKVYLTGKHSVDDYGESVYLNLEAIVENSTGHPIAIGFDACTVNDWDVYASGIGGVTSKKRATLQYEISDAGISTFEDVKTITCQMFVYDESSNSVMFRPDPVVIPFQ